MSIWDRLRIFKLFLQLVRNPNRTELIFAGIDIVLKNPDQEPIKDVEKRLMANDGFRSMFNEHYVPEIPSMEYLEHCPEGSYGEAVFRHMKGNGLNFDLFPRVESQAPVQYLNTRIYQDHDLWHALLGYGVEVEDELALQAFGIAQFQSPIAILLIAGGLLHLLGKNPKRAIEAFRKINSGYTIGSRAPLLLAVRLRDLFQKPLIEVRQICGVA